MKDGATISVSQAKAHLTQLVERAANGEVITITRRGKPGCQLVPLEARGTASIGSVVLFADGSTNEVPGIPRAPGKVRAATAAEVAVIGAGIDATPVNRSVATRNAAPRPQTSSKLAPQPAGLTLADLLKASR